MNLKEIRLNNFRQFRGEQKCALEAEGNKRVALVFGANGSGKTTLLNAFTWALYGSLSEDVESQERLVTDSLWAEANFGDEIPVEVEIVFEHEGIEYRAQRAVTVRKSGDAQSPVRADLRLWSIAADGSSSEVGAPQEKVESILPQRLSRFFFFNGERIEKLVHRRAYAEVKQDIKTLLGLEQVERALEHLPNVERKLSREIKKHGGEKAASISSQIEEATDLKSAFSSEIGPLESRVVEFQEERSRVLDLLRKHEGAGPLQKQRDEVNLQLQQQRVELDRVQIERRNAVATRGFVAFTSDLAIRASQLAEALHKQGALPAPLKREFVDSLLEEGRCICGTQLVEGTEANQEVLEWRARAGLAEVEAAWQRLRGDTDGLSSTKVDLRRSLQDFSDRIQTLRSSIGKNEEILTSLDVQLRELPLEDVQRLDGKQADLDSKIKQVDRTIGAKKQSMADAAAEVEKLNNELARAEVTDELAIKARTRLQLIKDVTQALTEILEIRSREMRVRLDGKVKAVFAEITVKPYFPMLSEDFELGLFQRMDDGELLPVPKSTGENQILSLSFVAAVSQLAREVRVERHSDGELHPEAGNYPIVMDAAFGSLDLNYQGAVSRALARMAPQMVVLVSKSQGMGEVIRELREHISHVGVITAHSTNQEQESESIELYGRAYSYIKTRADFDWAELKVVN